MKASWRRMQSRDSKKNRHESESVWKRLLESTSDCPAPPNRLARSRCDCSVLNLCIAILSTKLFSLFLQQEEIPRVPILCTGNDFSTLYAPLIRDGRMEKFYWSPSREDRVGVAMGIFQVGQPHMSLSDLAQKIAQLVNRGYEMITDSKGLICRTSIAKDSDTLQYINCLMILLPHSSSQRNVWSSVKIIVQFPLKICGNKTIFPRSMMALAKGKLRQLWTHSQDNLLISLVLSVPECMMTRWVSWVWQFVQPSLCSTSYYTILSK